MENETILEFKDFSFKYDAQIEPTLRNIDLTIRRGEKVLIAGPSGCGKSTLINCINGLIPFVFKGEMSGSLRINGRESREQSILEISNTVGTVLQDTDAQFVGMTVLEDIAFALENEEIAQDEMRERVQAAAELVGIASHMRYAPTELSGGQKQRVSIAGIIVDDVSTMLFDEPLANLDPATGKRAMQLIDDIHHKTGAATILVEHRLEDVLYREVDRIVLMHEGRIIFDGAPDVLLSSDLLTENGIREPLYITALKYAGVRVTPEMHPHSMDSLTLSGSDIERVRHWYHSGKKKESEPPAKPFLELKDVAYTYDERDKRALDGVNLTIGEGELVALVGRNGAGKSTLAKAICGFVTPQEGEMHLAGEDLRGLSIKERADRIGYVMQNPNKMISKTMIFDEVALGLRTRGVGEDEIRKRVEDTLRVCGLYEFRNWPISALSYGQKKRVTIASILVLKPEMLILDEPTAGQDYRHYTDIMEFLLSLNRRGLTILMITHDMHLMLEYARRSIVFCGGRVIDDETSAGVLTNPEIVEKAALKETSLYGLALSCGIAGPSDFVQHFIDHEREGMR